MTDLSTARLEEILALAAKATPGEWRPHDLDHHAWLSTVRVGNLVLASTLMSADSAYLAACNPPTIVAMVSEIIALRQLRDMAVEALTYLAARIDNDGTASQIGSADEVREIASALEATLSQIEDSRKMTVADDAATRDRLSDDRLDNIERISRYYIAFGRMTVGKLGAKLELRDVIAAVTELKARRAIAHEDSRNV